MYIYNFRTQIKCGYIAEKDTFLLYNVLKGDEKVAKVTVFKELSVGDTFDFVSPDIGMNSFYRKCRKISAKRYRDDAYIVHSVGSGFARVYHVNEALPVDHPFRGG